MTDDKPEIDFHRLEHLEEVRRREHSAAMAAMETYRQRMEERTERQQELSVFDNGLLRFNGRIPENYAEARERIVAKVENANRRFMEADKAREESSTQFQTAGRLYDRCREWLKDNKIEVNA